MTNRHASNRDFAFSDADFQDIAQLAYESFGLFLEPCKRQLVYSRLAKRLRHYGMTSFAEYRQFLRGQQGEDERRAMLSELTTNVTKFFRERHHFDKLRQEILPGLVQGAKSGKRVRFWSAGCSAGQEAYSMALTVLDVLPDAARYDIRILATDVDLAVLQKAVSGQYPKSELADIPKALRKSYILNDSNSKKFTVGPELRNLVSFGELNLVGNWPMKGSFDAIFCRNVAIYFDAETQKRLWKRFADALAIDGQLMVGHSERVAGPALDMFQPSGVTSYRKSKSNSV